MIKKNILLTLTLVFALIPNLIIADVDNSSENSCAVISTNLRYLSRDTNTNGGVSVLQDFLNSNGYLKSQPTGFFGGQTRSAVIAFQKVNTLFATPPGFVGPATRAMIKKIDCDSVASTTPVIDKPATTTVQAISSLAINPINQDSVYASSSYSFSSQSLESDSGTQVQFKVIFDKNKVNPSRISIKISCPLGINISAKGSTVNRCDTEIGLDSVGNNTYIANTYFTNLTNSTKIISANLVSNFPNSTLEYLVGTTEIKINSTKIISAPLPVAPVFNPIFNRNLEYGDKGVDVNALIKILIKKDFLKGTANISDDIFNLDVKTALTQLQTSVGISPADGKVGPLMRAYFNIGLINDITPTTPATTTTLVVSDYKCSVKVNNITYTLNPCNINATMDDTLGNKNFSTTISSSDDSSSSYGFSIKGYGVGFPNYGILGVSSGGAKGNTSINLYFNDSYLSSYNSLPKTYYGYLPIHIFQGSEVSDDNYLHLKINLTVNPKK